MALLQVTDLEVAYGEALALKGISIAVQAGTITSVLGANGSGKTTLLRTISRLIKQRRGNIILDGASIDDSQVHQVVRRGISHIPEGRGLLAEMTVIENLRLGSHVNSGSYLEEDLDKIHQLFPVLLERQNQQAGMLSGGEQQMLAIARGLLARPRLLLIDELSLGLAPRVTTALMQLLTKIKLEGVSVLLVEQNVHQALKISDWVYLLVNGEIKFSGPPIDLNNRKDLMSTYLGMD